ncbi:MAG: hypothetical protein R6V83_05035 [Candidatus Thorarchaeota archaeon]
MGDHDHTVAKTMEELAIAGVMTRDDDKRRKPVPRKESHSDERGQRPC